MKHPHPRLQRIQPITAAFFNACCWLPILLISPEQAIFFFAATSTWLSAVLSRYFGTPLSSRLSIFFRKHPVVALVTTIVTTILLVLVAVAFYSTLLSNPLSLGIGVFLLTASIWQAVVLNLLTSCIILLASALMTAFANRNEKQPAFSTSSTEPKSNKSKEDTVRASTPAATLGLLEEKKERDDPYKTPPRSHCRFPYTSPQPKPKPETEPGHYAIKRSPFSDKPKTETPEDPSYYLQEEILYKLLLASDDSGLLTLANEFCAYKKIYRENKESLQKVITLNYSNKITANSVTQTVEEHLEDITLLFEQEFNARVLTFQLLQILTNITSADPMLVAKTVAEARAAHATETCVRLDSICIFSGSVMKSLQEDDEKSLTSLEPKLKPVSDYLVEHSLTGLGIEGLSLGKLANYVEVCASNKRLHPIVREEKEKKRRRVEAPMYSSQSTTLARLAEDLIDDSCAKMANPDKILLDRVEEKVRIVAKYKLPRSQAMLLHTIKSQAEVLAAKKHLQEIIEKLLDEKLTDDPRAFEKLTDLQAEFATVAKPLQQYMHLISFNYLNTKRKWLTLPFDVHIELIEFLFSKVRLQCIVNGISANRTELYDFYLEKLAAIVAELNKKGFLMPEFKGIIPKAVRNMELVYDRNSIKLPLIYQISWIQRVLKKEKSCFREEIIKPWEAIEAARCDREWQSSKRWDPEVGPASIDETDTLPGFPLTKEIDMKLTRRLR